MTKYVFNKCCFCVDLRVGCFVIGYINLIMSIIFTVLAVIEATGNVKTTSYSDPDVRNAGTGTIVIGFITLLIIAILLGFSIVLLIGLHKRKPGHVKAFIVYWTIFLVLSLIILVTTLARGSYDGRIISFDIISLLFSLYFVLVLRSYYHQMMDGSAGPHQYNA